MKVRMDFVTNSSSSSFVLAYNSEQDLEQEISKQIFGLCWDETDNVRLYPTDRDNIPFYINRIVSDLKDPNKQLTFKEAEKKITEEIRDRGILVYYRNHFNDINDDFYEEDRDTFLDNYVAENLPVIMDKIKDKKHIVKVSYADEDGQLYGALEHDIVPNLKECIEIFSHH